MATDTQNYEIAVIGPEDVVSGFKALGVHVFDASDSETALATIKDLRQQTIRQEDGTNYATIYVIDHLLRDIPADEYEKVTSGPLPAVIAIPGLKADKEAGKRKLRALAKKAIGSDILSNE